MIERLNIRVLIFVSLIASSSLGLELLQTRILSALYFNHVVYMTVTIALLGFGFSGVLVSIFHKRISNHEQFAAYCAAGMSITTLMCVYAASSLPGVMESVPVLYKMVLSYFFLVLPFLFAGGALSLIFMSHGDKIFKLYFFDLSASAIAAILFCLLLWPLGAPNCVWLCSMTALIAFLIITRNPQLTPRQVRNEIFLFVSLFILAYLCIGQKIVSNQPESYKATAAYYNPSFDAKLETSAWTNIAKIDVFSDPTYDLLSGKYLGQEVGKRLDLMVIAQDNDAPTFIHGINYLNLFKKLAKQHKPIEVNTISYMMKPNPADVLVIGVGGGIDICLARIYGAQNIDGVEINPATIKLVTEKFKNYAQWPMWENIHIYNSEGRHFVHNSRKKYDVIEMHGVDTFSALNSGAYVLTENYLYTVNAIKDYLNDLKPDGMMVILRWFFLQPRETLRLANLFLNAAPSVGHGPANQRIMIINHGAWAATFIKREPFTLQEINTAAKMVNSSKEFAWVYVPKIFGNSQKTFETIQFQRFHDKLSIARQAFESLINAPGGETRNEFIRAYPYKIDAVYDDSPFFFEYYKGKFNNVKNEYWQFHGFNDSTVNLSQVRGPMVHYVLYILLFLVILVCVIGMGIPLMIFEKRGIKILHAPSLIYYFSSLGFGFIFIEIGCMQWCNLYLGYPMYTLAVVLASLLFYAGLGSLFAGKLHMNFNKKIIISMLGTACLVPVWMVLTKYMMPLTEHLSTGFRIGVIVLTLIPLGLSMGFPFATGLSYLSESAPQFIPWAWGINGLTSVAASIIAIIIAMKFGFTLVLITGSIIYLSGYLVSRYGFIGAAEKVPSNPPFTPLFQRGEGGI